MSVRITDPLHWFDRDQYAFYYNFNSIISTEDLKNFLESSETEKVITTDRIMIKIIKNKVSENIIVTDLIEFINIENKIPTLQLNIYDNYDVETYKLCLDSEAIIMKYLINLFPDDIINEILNNYDYYLDIHKDDIIIDIYLKSISKNTIVNFFNSVDLTDKKYDDVFMLEKSKHILSTYETIRNWSDKYFYWKEPSKLKCLIYYIRMKLKQEFCLYAYFLTNINQDLDK